MFRYIVYVLSLNNSKFGDYVNRIYLQELEIKDIPDTDRFVLYLDLHVDIDSEGWLKNFATKEMISIFPLWTFYFDIATFQQHLYMEYIYLIWYDISEFDVPIMIFLIGVPANKDNPEPRVTSR